MRVLGAFLKDPRQITQGLVRKILSNRIKDDRYYLSLVYFATFWRKMNWDNPSSFNEKMNWLKIYGRNPQYTTMVDKYLVKKYVSGIIGDKYVVENYAVADSWDGIDWDSLPSQFVIKCTHDSGGAFVCRDKTTFDYDGTRHIIEKNLATYNYYFAREWPYKDVPHRIIVDRFLDEHTGRELNDYKFWCFNGKPVYMYCTNKANKIHENFYDMEFNPVWINHGFPRHVPEFQKPAEFEEMKELAQRLSEGIPFVRVDFFDVDGHIYFGEFTFFDWGGLRPFASRKLDLELGNLLILPDRLA